MERVDARGLSCPEPVILTRKALLGGAKEYEVLVDNVTSRENGPASRSMPDIPSRSPRQEENILCL